MFLDLSNGTFDNEINFAEQQLQDMELQINEAITNFHVVLNFRSILVTGNWFFFDEKKYFRIPTYLWIEELYDIKGSPGDS